MSLIEFAHEHEKPYVEAFEKRGSLRSAALELGVDRSTVTKHVKRAQMRAARCGVAPDRDVAHRAMEGYFLDRVSTNYNQAGEISQQWVIQKPDQNAQFAAFREAVEDLCKGVKPLRPMAPPKVSNSDLLTIYPWGDPHIGMYSWWRESGEDFDCDIARADIAKAMSYLTTTAPDSETGVLLNLGDFFHADNPSNQTPRSGNQLDVDTRMPRVYRVGIEILVDAISMMLRKHDKVIAMMRPGNHDPYTSQMLSANMDAWFRNEPRVTVMPATGYHDYLRHGKVLIGATHGNMPKAAKRDLGLVMAHDRREDWGETLHRYWYMGHIHTQTVEELTGGVLVETFRNLPPNDAWHQAEGYRSGRNMCAITHHKDHGEIARSTCDISMVRNA